MNIYVTLKELYISLYSYTIELILNFANNDQICILYMRDCLFMEIYAKKRRGQ